MVLMLLHLGQKLVSQGHRLFHRFMDRLPAEFIPRRRDDRRVRVLAPDHGDRLINLILIRVLCSGQNDRPGALDLVVVELAEVLHIHPDLFHIGNSYKRTDFQIAFLRCILNSAAYI